MRSLVFVPLALCLVFMFVQTEANPPFMAPENKHGGIDAIFQGVDVIINLCVRMMESLEAKIREGKSVSEAIPELMNQLPSMVS